MNYRNEQSVDGTNFIVRTNDDGTESWIPVDESNSDYQTYLSTLASESDATPTA